MICGWYREIGRAIHTVSDVRNFEFFLFVVEPKLDEF